MINFSRARQRSQWFVSVAFFVVFLSACAGPAHQPASPAASAAENKAKPLQAWSPEPVPASPVRAKVPGITKIVVPSIKTKPKAIYRESQPQLQLSIPDFEIPVTGAGKGKKLVRVPGPVDVEKTGIVNPKPLSWTTSETGFLSTDFDDNGAVTGGFRFIPPDSHAAAGPDHVVNVVNVTVTFHQKDGAIDYQESLKTFFSSLTPLTFTFDTKVLYDQYAGRWVVITMEQTAESDGDAADTSRMFVAVSDDSDPNGTWYFSEFPTAVDIGGTAHWADYPGFAVDEEAVYITANMFPFSGGASGGVRLWILDKGIGTGGIYDTGSALSVAEIDPYPPTSSAFDLTTQPSHMFGTAPAGLGVFLVGYSGLSNGDEFIQVVRIDDPLGATPVFTLTFVLVDDFEDTSVVIPDMPQSGSAELIESNDRRALDAVWRNDALWLTTTIVNGGEATALWVKIDTSNLASLVSADYGTIGGEQIATGTYTTFPSIAVNANNDVVVGFSASAPSIFAGAYFVDRQSSDPPGFMGDPVVVKAGEDYYLRTFGGPRNRWGDYSGTAVDPVNSCFWVYNQWADIRGTMIIGEDGRWGTAYSKTCSTVCNATQYIDAGTWTRFALPCSVTSNTVADIFGGPNPDDLDLADYGDTWGVFGRDSSVPNYFLVDINDPLLEGSGYWVYSPTLTQVNVNGAPASTADIDLVGLTEGRFNYVGHNQNVSVDWNQVQVVDGVDVLDYGEYDTLNDPDYDCDVPVQIGCVMSRIMHKWNGSAYQVFDGVTDGILGTLEPFDAFWVEAFKPGIKLRIPVGAAVTGAAPVSSTVEGLSSIEGRGDQKFKKPKKPKKPKNQPWHIRLIASAGNMEDPGNVLGQLETAGQGNDPHDLEEPLPYGDQYLSILFTNPLFEQVDWGFTTDFRAMTKNPQGIWPFKVKAHAGISEVTVSWQGEDHLFNDAWLVDEHSGEMIRVKAGESYSFDIEGGEHHFRFEVGDG
jgi:hypothetical protein